MCVFRANSFGCSMHIYDICRLCPFSLVLFNQFLCLSIRKKKKKKKSKLLVAYYSILVGNLMQLYLIFLCFNTWHHLV